MAFILIYFTCKDNALHDIFLASYLLQFLPNMFIDFPPSMLHTKLKNILQSRAHKKLCLKGQVQSDNFHQYFKTKHAGHVKL